MMAPLIFSLSSVSLLLLFVLLVTADSQDAESGTQRNARGRRLFGGYIEPVPFTGAPTPDPVAPVPTPSPTTSLEPSSSPSSTPSSRAPLTAITLGSASSFVILSKTGITNAGTSVINGDIGVSPINAASITGFGLTADASTTFSTAAQVNGRVYAADYAPPTPGMLTTAVQAFTDAYNEAAFAVDVGFSTVGLNAGLISNEVLSPGLYTFSYTVTVNNVNAGGDLMFSGDSNSVWIIQIAGALIFNSGASIALEGGALAQNIFFQVAGGVTFGTTTDVHGVFLSASDIVFLSGSRLHGAAYSDTQVTLDTTTLDLCVEGGATVC